MKQVRLIVSIVLVLALVCTIAVFAAGLLPFGQVDIPAEESSSTQPAPTGYPSGSVQQPQIMYEGQIYYYTANGFDAPLPLGYQLVGTVEKVDNNDPPTENWVGGRVDLGQAIYAREGSDSIYVQYESGYAEFGLRK